MSDGKDTQFDVQAGDSTDLGAVHDGEGTNFAIFSAHAERVAAIGEASEVGKRPAPPSLTCGIITMISTNQSSEAAIMPHGPAPRRGDDG